MPGDPSLSEFNPVIDVKNKFALAMTFSICWFVLTTWIALPWMRDLARLT